MSNLRVKIASVFTHPVSWVPAPEGGPGHVVDGMTTLMSVMVPAVYPVAQSATISSMTSVHVSSAKGTVAPIAM